MADQGRQTEPFWRWLVAITLAGFVGRVYYSLSVFAGTYPLGDGAYYHEQANALSQGAGFIDPMMWPQLSYQAAHHPPLYTVYLAAASVVGLDTPDAHRVLSCIAGSAAIALVGVLGKRLAGPRAGLLAAGLAAAYPNLWLNDGLVLSESLYAPLVAGLLILSYSFLDRPDFKRAAGLGALLALVVLTRAEAVNLIVFLVVPLVYVAVRPHWRRGVALLAVIGVVAALVVAPWIGHNLARFDRPVYLSVGASGVLPSANCDETYDGPLLGYWSARCTFPDPEAVSELFKADPDEQRLARQGQRLLGDGDESVFAETNLERGIEYVRAHKGRAVVVAFARVGRIWDLYRPGQAVTLNHVIEGRPKAAAMLGLVVYYELLALGVLGLVVLRRRRISILPFVSLAILVTVTAAVAIGLNRYRAPIEIGLVVLGGVAIDAILRWAMPAKKRARTRQGSA